MIHNSQIRSYTMIEITKRLCSDKVQTNIQVGSRFIVNEVSKLSDGTPLLIVRHPQRKRATLRINASRFQWRVVSSQELVMEKRFKAEQERRAYVAKLLNDNFTETEQRQILFVPGAILEMAVAIAKQVPEYCRGKKKLKIEPLYQYYELTKQLGRVIEALEADKKMALGDRATPMENAVSNFMEGAHGHLFFFRLMNVIQDRWRAVVPDISDRFLNMRTYAVTGWLMVEMLLKHEKYIDDLITKKFGGCYPHTVSDNVEKLGSLMYQYAETEKCGFTVNQMIQCGFDGLMNEINKIPFDFINCK